MTTWVTLRMNLPQPEIAHVLATWRRRPVAVAAVLLAVVLITGLVVAVGGPPTPITHLYYIAVVLAAVLWGPRVGLVAGATCAALAEPGALALLGKSDQVDQAWLVRGGAMMLVGWVCGSLTRSLLERVQELEALNQETIFAFVRAIDARDPYTARHSEKVAGYAVQLAHALGLPDVDCERIHLSGMLHDVGKVALERSVLHKPGALSDDEWQQVRRHPALSAHIIGAVARFAIYVPGARHHHERYDGRGYPDGLAGEAIPFDARILAVADAYDAMTSDRSYRPALGHDEAVARLQAEAGTQFDPACVEAFAALKLDRHDRPFDEPLVPLLDFQPVSDVA
ncbi:MAG TPA: HD domain-containing phosphohydrolase [Baekduia sp.]|uniref:HD domain-containing phosphohydrolase n=1 Tax=Baekduia sp. TaxID=2600305 RepID=UPI002C26E446|nr:HD domain-containing phosphohydrolase [Baekduia sp.]HMJ33766.1 HD domain-containing phosphohydrolase [Baekduia sp.]